MIRRHGKIGLTKREQEVVALICQGKKRAEIAAALSVSEHVIKGHISEINYHWGTRDMREIAIRVARHTPSSFQARPTSPVTMGDITLYG